MNRNIVVLLAVRVIANFADSFYFLASVWYVKDMTDSSFWVGVTTFVAMVPVAFQVLYGPLIDRYDKKKLLLLAMAVQAIVCTILAGLYVIDELSVGVVIVGLFVATLASELSYPTEYALVPTLVREADLQKVNALFTFTYHSLDILCNAIAGILLALIGVGLVYTSNAILYLFLFGAIGFLLRINETKRHTPSDFMYFADLRFGFRYVWKLGSFRTLILVFTCLNFMISISLGVLPILAKTEQEYGLWLAAISIGTLLGSGLSIRFGVRSLRWTFVLATGFGGVAWCISAFWLNRNFGMTLICFSMAWMAIGMMGIQFQTLLQRQIEPDYLGRVLTVVYALQGVLAPFGYLLGGALADWVAHGLLYLVGAVTLLGTSHYFLRNSFLKSSVAIRDQAV